MGVYIKCIRYVLCLLSIVTYAQSVIAETLYVRDELYIALREGPSDEYETIKTIKTGTPMEVLEEGDPFVKVRLHSGEEGYVKKWYLSKDIPKQTVISSLNKEVDQLKTRLAESEETRMALTQQFKTEQEKYRGKDKELKNYTSELNESLAKSNDELQTITEKYNTLLQQSEQIVETTKERDLLQKENSQLISEAQVLKKENKKLIRAGAIRWFLAGGGVFFFGWIIGKISRKKRSRL